MNAYNRIGLALGAMLMAGTNLVARAADCPVMTDVSSPKWHGTMVHHLLAASASQDVVANYDPNKVVSFKSFWPGLHYWVYVPPSAAAKKSPSLVVYLHGSSQYPISAARGVRWNELADERGFIVAYPAGADCNGWGWGQSTGYGHGVGELEAVSRIVREVQQATGANPKRTYIVGASSGAIAATMAGALYADFFTAVGSVLGCSYNCADPTGIEAYKAVADNNRVKVVPAFLAHGTLDYIFTPELQLQADTQWVGTNDFADDGTPDGSISPVPEIDVSHMTVLPAPTGSTDNCWIDPMTGRTTPNQNPCTSKVLGYDKYPYEIHRFKDKAGRTIVESWYIHGMSHNYPNGDPEGSYTDPAGPDINLPMWNFFESINSPPFANDDAATTRKGTAVTLDVLGNDTDADGDDLSITAVSQGAYGTVTQDGATLTYAPRHGFSGRDSFSYTVSDAHGGSDTGQVTVCVTPGRSC